MYSFPISSVVGFAAGIYASEKMRKALPPATADPESVYVQLAHRIAHIETKRIMDAIVKEHILPKTLESPKEAPKPPLRARRLLDWMAPPGRGRELSGDLEEIYSEVVLPRDGEKAANRWYWWMTIRSIFPLWKQATVAGLLAWFWEKFSS